MARRELSKKQKEFIAAYAGNATEAAIAVGYSPKSARTSGSRNMKDDNICKQFLDEVALGVSYTTVFISSVFNSVPFIADRRQIAVIAAALCYPAGITACWCQSDKATTIGAIKTRQFNRKNARGLSFDLGYEPHIIMGGLSKSPKVQKGHLKDELAGIFTPCFKTIRRLDYIDKFWYLEAAEPILSPELLADAIDFEFNLPYPDGTRAGLSEMARNAFEQRLSIKLPKRGERP